MPRGERGIIAVRQPNPVTMIEYWKNPEATQKKFAGEFLLTGDLGRQDEDGYFWYLSREDDVITTAGYRVGPSEIEDCLLKHPAVAMSAVVGIPDPVRTESIKAWIVLRPGFAPSEDLAREIQEFVKVKLAAHEYPRFVQFTEKPADDGDRKGAAARVAGEGMIDGAQPGTAVRKRQSIFGRRRQTCNHPSDNFVTKIEDRGSIESMTRRNVEPTQRRQWCQLRSYAIIPRRNA